jgi:UrcA family protein
MSIVAKMVAVSACSLMSTAAMASGIPFESNGRTFEVAYKDLDLSKTADQRELTRRVRRAAVKVCPGKSVKESRSCQLAALDHVREPVAAAIASAQGRDAGRFAEVSKDKVPGSGD